MSKKIRLEDIDIRGMTRPDKEDFIKSEKYFLKQGEPEQDIFVTKDLKIVDGFCSYLIAQKYNYDNIRIHVINDDQGDRT